MQILIAVQVKIQKLLAMAKFTDCKSIPKSPDLGKKFQLVETLVALALYLMHLDDIIGSRILGKAHNGIPHHSRANEDLFRRPIAMSVCSTLQTDSKYCHKHNSETIMNTKVLRQNY